MRNFSLVLVLLMMSTLGFAADGGAASGLTNPESHKTEIKNHIKQNKKDIKGRIKNELKDAKDKGASDTEILLIILARLKIKIYAKYTCHFFLLIFCVN